MNQGARDANENMYRQKTIALLECIAAKSGESAPSALHNSAMLEIAVCVNYLCDTRVLTDQHALSSIKDRINAVVAQLQQ